MKKAVFFISACLMTAAVAACVMPFKENKEETSIFDSGVEGLPDGENGCMAGLPDGKENAVQETGGAENEPVFGSVPYFQDNTGRLVQTEDGYFYGYWGGVLARYDADTLERTVLYEAASEQRGEWFCLYGDWVYFLEVPDISPYGKKILLYRVRKDGTELTLLDENVPDAGQLYDGYEYQSYLTMDICENVLYLVRGDKITCHRLNGAGEVEPADITTDLPYRIPPSMPYGYSVSRSKYYPDCYTFPYCARNFGFFLVYNEEGGLGRVAADSEEWEEITLPEGFTAGVNSLYLTHEAYWFPGAHGMYESNCYVFDRGTGLA
ncbi:MAG: DUF5050 domain-containing protein [Lachnospiraceae bacterium]